MNSRDPLHEPDHDAFMRQFVQNPQGVYALKKIDRDLARDGRQKGESISDAFVIFATTMGAAAKPLNYTLSKIRLAAHWATARRGWEVSVDDETVMPLLERLYAEQKDEDEAHAVDDDLYLRRHTAAGKRKITKFLKELSPAQRKYAVMALAGLAEEEIQERLGRSREQVASMLAALCGEKPLPPAPRRRKKPAPAFLAAQQPPLFDEEG